MISALNAIALIQISQWRRSFFQMAAITNSCLSHAHGAAFGSHALPSHAQRTLGVLTGRVRPDRRAEEDVAGIDDDARIARLRCEEAVETARRRARLLLADAVVLRAVTRALEPLRRLAERDATTEVHAALVERDDPELRHVLEDRGLVDLLGGL